MKSASKDSNPKGRLVYSTELGRTCPDCRNALAQCTCKQAALATKQGDGQVRVSLQTKGRGGKSVTVIKGLTLDAIALAALGKQLRTACGSGGTVKEGVIEIQGDHCEKMVEYLKAQGFMVKKS